MAQMTSRGRMTAEGIKFWEEKGNLAVRAAKEETVNLIMKASEAKRGESSVGTPLRRTGRGCLT
jgi:hypothetical protein